MKHEELTNKRNAKYRQAKLHTTRNTDENCTIVTTVIQRGQWPTRNGH